MSTPTVSSPGPLSRPLSRQTLVVTGVILAIVAAIVVLALTVSTTTRSTSPQVVQVTPRGVIAAQASDATHFGNQTTGTSNLSAGMGHR